MTRAIILISLLTASCATTNGGTCASPVQDACTAKAQSAQPELTAIAAQRGVTTDEMTTEFVNACEEQLQSDLDQTLADLGAIVDAGGGAQLQIRKGTNK